MAPQERTSRVLAGTMNNVMEGIKLTVETNLDHDGKWLPTLDVNLAIDEENRVKFKYFEKSMSTNTVLNDRTAMDENQKMQILSQEAVRRMLNTSEDMDEKTRRDIIDKLGQKMMTSGYSIQKTRRAIHNGIKYYETKKRRCQEESKPLYRNAKLSQAGRYKKKLLAKTSWYKKKRKDLSVAQPSNQKNKKKGPKKSQDLPNVIFVEHTPGGELAKRLRELLERLQYHLGSKIKVVEKTGTLLKDMFPLTHLWEGAGCGREECHTCKQGSEELPNCKKRNIVYESICALCNPGALKKGPLKVYDSSKPSLYVGETARSLQERSREHIADLEARSSNSHMWKHQEESHGGSKEARFVFKIVETPKSALSRQIGEAIRIRRRGGEGGILNARGEYNRCHITRLTLGEDSAPSHGIASGGGEGEQADKWLEDQGVEWILKKGRGRRHADKAENRAIGEQEKLFGGKSSKRSNQDQNTRKGGSKRRKYKLVDTNWGNQDKGDNLNLNSYSRLFKESDQREKPDSPQLYSYPDVENQEHTVDPDARRDEHPVENDTVENDVENVDSIVIVVDPDASRSEHNVENDPVNTNTRSNKHPVENSSVDPEAKSIEHPVETDVLHVDNNIMGDEKNCVKRNCDKPGDCVIKRRTCTLHGVQADVKKVRKSIWTKIKRTGLYGYLSVGPVLSSKTKKFPIQTNLIPRN